MALTVRTGLSATFDPYKLVPGELALVIDKQELYYCYSAGNVKKLQTEENIREMLNASGDALASLQQAIVNLNSNPSQLTSLLNTQIDINNAKKGKPTFKAKIDELDSQVAATVKQGSLDIQRDMNKSISKIDETMLTDTLLQQIAGTAPINAVPADYSIPPTKTTFFEKIISKNLFSYNAASLNTIINSDGTTSANINRVTTDFIPLTALNRSILSTFEFTPSSGSKYRMLRNFKSFAGYDVNKNFVPGTYATEISSYTATDPNIAYVRGSWLSSDFTGGDLKKFMIEYGTTVNSSLDHYDTFWTKYVVPEEYFPDGSLVKKTSQLQNDSDFITKDMVAVNTSKVRAFIPKDLYVAQGRTIEFYNRNVIASESEHNLIFVWTCTVGKSLKGKFQVNATALNTGNYPLELKICNLNLDVLITLTSTLHIVSNVIASNFAVCPIGDSLTNGKPWMPEIRLLSNNKIKFVGTRWAGDVQGGNYNHEGRSGVTALWYLGNNTYSYTDTAQGVTTSNPFFNPTTSSFDLNYYRNTYGISFNGIQLYLGMNGLNMHFNGTEYEWNKYGNNTQITSLKTIIDKIRLTDSNMPIFLCYPQFKGDQNAEGYNTPSDGFTDAKGIAYRWHMAIFNIMITISELLQGYSNIYYIPLSIGFDDLHGYTTQSVPVNPRSSITETVQIEAVHPDTSLGGYLQFADLMFSAYCAYLSGVVPS